LPTLLAHRTLLAFAAGIRNQGPALSSQGSSGGPDGGGGAKAVHADESDGPGNGSMLDQGHDWISRVTGSEWMESVI
jgi:hypothetical protein